ncbi:MAG: hypothetical protein R3D58_03900 [Saprospiraceae bacterium]|nr:hypothetical protein [Lewinellaceae bacterium]
MFKQTLFSALFLVATLTGNSASFNAAPGIPASPAQVDQLVTLFAGTQVFVTLNEMFNAEEVSVGNSIDFMVRSNVTVNGKVLIAAGATATGWVKSVKKACDGKCAEITITVESAQAVDGQTVNLRSVPHTIQAPCCCGTATANLGTNLRAFVLNDVKVNA